MARLTPSIVVQAIEATFSWAKASADKTGQQAASLSSDQSPNIGMLVALVDALPSELLPMDSNGQLAIVAGQGAMRAALDAWASGANPGHLPLLRPLPALGGKQPIVAILEVLRRLPDEAPHQGTAELLFLENEDIRLSLRTDASSAHRALGNGEFKAATVLAGSVIEALLLWRLEHLLPAQLAEAKTAANRARTTKGQQPVSQRPLEHWILSDFIDVALGGALIDDVTASNLRLSNEYRNLIHAGRVKRTGNRASAATALSALGGMERLIEVLERNAA